MTTEPRYTRVSYRIMTEFDEGVMSEPFFDERSGETLPPYDMHVLGPHPFSQGYPSAELAQDTLRRAREYVAGIGPGRAWLERVTETTTIEEVEDP